MDFCLTGAGRGPLQNTQPAIPCCPHTCASCQHNRRNRNRGHCIRLFRCAANRVFDRGNCSLGGHFARANRQCRNACNRCRARSFRLAGKSTVAEAHPAVCMDHACAGHGAGGEFDNVVIAMDERQRQIFEKAFAILDRREADAREHARWLGRHFDPVLGRVDLGEPTTEVEPTSPPPPQPRQTSQLTDAQILRSWLPCLGRSRQ